MDRALQFTGQHNFEGFYLAVLAARADSGWSAATGSER